MVNKTETLTAQIDQIKLSKSLNCKDFGIYVANCLHCTAQYVGQAVVSISARWTQYRNLRNKSLSITNFSNDNNASALIRHTVLHHKESTKPKIYQCFNVLYVDKPQPDNLIFSEASWFRITNASINLQKMILPRVK